jgi:hypothetical protein
VDRGAPSTIRHLVLVAVLGGLAALAGLPGRATLGARVSGDEPHYLLTATSLARDHDLDIADEVATAAYLDYHEVPIDPQSVVGDGGRRISPHDPLLPLILALPFAAGGWVGAKAALAALAAATAAMTWWLAVNRLGVRAPTATVVVSGAFAGIPLAAYGSQIYPEMPAALALTGAVVATTSPALPHRRGPVALAFLAVVALPWLSVKYVPVATVAGLALAWRLRGRPARLAWLVVGAVGAAVAYAVAHRLLYGGWTVYAAGDHFVDDGELAVVGTEIDLLGRSRRLTGLLVDGVFGLAVWSPLWALLVPAAGWAARRPRPPVGLALVLVGTGWSTATFLALTMHGWWVPGRQLVVVLPLAAAVVAAWVDRSTGRRRAAALLGLVGATNWLWLAVEAATGRRTLIVDFAETGAPAFRALSVVLPDGMRGGTVDTALLVAWSAVIVAVGAAGARRVARDPVGAGATAGAAMTAEAGPPG